jgi:glycine/D-amino acid oxidase-like deaminating enzyme
MQVIIVGGGVIGLLTAMECVLAGGQVDLVDQAGIPSPAATSFDRHRIIRALHRGDAPLTRAAARAHQGWLDVERRLGAQFYYQVGALTAMPAEEVRPSLALLTAAGAGARTMSPGELSARYPRIRFPAGLAAVVESAAGAVLADKALTALAHWLRGQPAVRLHQHRRAVGVDEAGAVRLADGGILAGDRVVVAAGPWSRELLPAALRGNLTLYRQSMLSYAPAPSREAWAGMPAIPALGTSYGAWLMPPVADTPVRLSAASACRAVAEMTDCVTPGRWLDHLIGLFSTLLADFDLAAVAGATDRYYLADISSGGPLLATFGEGAIWAYAACGGMSFKFAPLIASAVADRAMGRSPRPTGLRSIDQPLRFAAAREGSA